MKPTILGVVSIAMVVCGCAGGSAPPPYKPVADMKLLMNAVLDPAADVIWGAAGTIISTTGTEELGPKTEEEWLHVRNNAVTLSESGNLLMMSPRARDDGEWMRLSQALVDTAAEAISAADARSVDRVFTVGGDIYVICSNCHAKYMDAIAQANE